MEKVDSTPGGQDVLGIQDPGVGWSKNPPDPAILLQGRDLKEFSHRSSGAMCDYAQGDDVYGVYGDRVGKHLGAPHWELWKSRVWTCIAEQLRST